MGAENRAEERTLGRENSASDARLSTSSDEHSAPTPYLVSGDVGGEWMVEEAEVTRGCWFEFDDGRVCGADVVSDPKYCAYHRKRVDGLTDGSVPQLRLRTWEEKVLEPRLRVRRGRRDGQLDTNEDVRSRMNREARKSSPMNRGGE